MKEIKERADETKALSEPTEQAVSSVTAAIPSSTLLIAPFMTRSLSFRLEDVPVGDKECMVFMTRHPAYFLSSVLEALHFEE